MGKGEEEEGLASCKNTLEKEEKKKRENSLSPDRRRIKSVRKWASLSQEVWQKRRRWGMVGGGGGSLGWWVGSSQ